MHSASHSAIFFINATPLGYVDCGPGGPLTLCLLQRSIYDSGMLRLATLYLEFEFSANSNITTCRFSVWVLLEAILFIPNLCSMIPQINSIDSCHSNLSSLMNHAPKYGGLSLRFRKTRVI